MTRSDSVPELTNGEFESFTKQGLVLIDFFADWCMPCVMMGPVLEEVAENLRGKLKVGKVNVDENQHLAQKFKVSSIPNFVLLKDGRPVDQFIGGMSPEDLEDKISQHLN